MRYIFILGRFERHTRRMNIRTSTVLIFINNLGDICSDSIKLYLFADDSKLYYHVENNGDMDLHKIKKLYNGLINGK